MALRWNKLSKKSTSHVNDQFIQISPESSVSFSKNKLWLSRARIGVTVNGRHG